MGPAGLLFMENLPGFEAYMIDPNGMAAYTSGFERYVSHD
jgi:thiamine biosynthesis lipoprotein ApbE